MTMRCSLWNSADSLRHCRLMKSCALKARTVSAALMAAPKLFREWAPRITTRKYDPAQKPPVEKAGLFEQAHRALDRGDADFGIGLHGAAVQFLHIGMVVGFRQYAGDNAALTGHLHTPFDTNPFQARWFNLVAHVISGIGFPRPAIGQQAQ